MGHEGDEEEGSHEGHEGDEEEGSHEGNEGDEEEGSHEGNEGDEEEGSKEKTAGGMTAKDLLRNKYGKVVSKKKSAFAKKSPWIQAVTKARKALKITGFAAIKKGTPLYAKAKEFFNQ